MDLQMFVLSNFLITFVLLGLNRFAPTAPQLTDGAGTLSQVDEQRLARAQSFLDKGDTTSALPLFLQVLQDAPVNYPTNESVGLIYAEAAEYNKAIPYLQKAVSVAPGQSVAHANLGAAYLQAGKNSDALTELSRAAELDPADVQVHSNLGQALMNLGQPVRAAQSFAAAAATGPLDANLLYNWALALYDSSEAAKASEVLAKIPPARLDDQSESLYGDAEEKQGHYQDAVKHLRHAAELSPTEPNVYALAVELLRHWAWPQAREVCTFGRTRFPTSDRLETALGIAEYGNGNYQEAANAFSNLLAGNSANTTYADMLGRSCEQLTDAANGSCKRLEFFADNHPENAQTSLYAASSIIQRPSTGQDIPHATRLLDQAMKDDPQLSGAYYQMGVIDQLELHWEESVVSLQKAISLKPTFAAAHYRLARAYFHLGDQVRGKEEMALHQQFEKQEHDSVDRILKDVTLFLFKQP